MFILSPGILIQILMARTITTPIILRGVDKTTRENNNITFGSGVIMPGYYTFADADHVQVRYETETFEGWNRPFTKVEMMTTNGRWINLGFLLRKTKSNPNSDMLEYVNDWVLNYSTIWDIAEALAGHTLYVSDKRVVTYTNYFNGERMEHPRVYGAAFKAEIIETPSDGR